MNAALLLLVAHTHGLPANTVVLDIHANQRVTKVSPDMYGIFFEEINQAGEGGIYAELLRNRGLESATVGTIPTGWESLGRGGTLAVDASSPLNEAHQKSLKIDRTDPVTPFGAANLGFWGIHIERGAQYRLTLWVKGNSPIDVSLDGGLGSAAKTRFAAPGPNWIRVERTLTSRIDDSKAKLTIIPSRVGAVWVAYSSLMPAKTWKNRANGMRLDLASKVASMEPGFVRFPGGCYVEGGDHLAEAFDWKQTVKPMAERVGLGHTMWGYSNSYGLGFHEYLQWCEDMGAAPLFVVNVGLCHKEMTPMAEMGLRVQDTLDAIEYANGPATSKWGALRAKNGHPKSFHLKYIEIGNENGATWSFGGPKSYADRYKPVYDAIKSVHPEIVTIADNPVPHPMEIVDEHYYEDPSWFWRNSTRYDRYPRTGPKIYVGEYAVTQGCGEGNLVAALGEAAFMTGMERNSDVVSMSSYAPLLVNVNNRQWNPNAIVFDNSRSYGTPSYYVQQLFSANRPDWVVAQNVDAAPGPAPAIQGTVSLQTWKTQADFKDIELVVDGAKTYSSAGLRPDGLRVTRGDWKVEDGTIHQTSLDQDRIATLTDIDLRGAKTYALTLKARRVSGLEGFMVQVEGHDGQFLTWNVGGWNNSQTAFQRNGTITGKPVTNHPIEVGRWYEVKIEREGNRTRGYIDGQLWEELVEESGPEFATVTGIDDRVHELVIKAVNGSDSAKDATISIDGVKLGSTASVQTMTGEGPMTENSFAAPTRVSPQKSVLRNVTGKLRYIFAPRSVTILRIPILDSVSEIRAKDTQKAPRRLR